MATTETSDAVGTPGRFHSGRSRSAYRTNTASRRSAPPTPTPIASGSRCDRRSPVTRLATSNTTRPTAASSPSLCRGSTVVVVVSGRLAYRVDEPAVGLSPLSDSDRSRLHTQLENRSPSVPRSSHHLTTPRCVDPSGPSSQLAPCHPPHRESAHWSSEFRPAQPRIRSMWSIRRWRSSGVPMSWRTRSPSSPASASAASATASAPVIVSARPTTANERDVVV